MTDITKIIGDPPPRQDVKVEDALRAAINIAGEVAEDLGVPGGGLILQLGGTLADAWTRRLRRAPIAPELAQVGDIVLVPLGEASEAVGICTGRHAALLTAEDGLAMLPMRLATRAWRLRADGEESPPCAP